MWTEERNGRVFEALEKRGRALVIGVSGLGKTRLVIEVLRRLANEDSDFKNMLVVAVDKSPDVPTQCITGKLLGRKWRYVVLLFDDLERYIGKFDIAKLVSSFRKISKKVAVVATCRKEEFQKIEDEPDVVRLFSQKDGDYINIPVYSTDEGREMAKGVHKEFSQEDFRGTADSIVLQTMRGREYYRNSLSDSEKSVLRTMKLLKNLGITTALTIREVQLVWNEVFHGQNKEDWNSSFNKVKKYYNLWVAPRAFSRNKDPIYVGIPDVYLDSDKGIVEDYPTEGQTELLEHGRIVINIFQREGGYFRLHEIGRYLQCRGFDQNALECYDAALFTVKRIWCERGAGPGPSFMWLTERVLGRKYEIYRKRNDLKEAITCLDEMLKMNEGPWKTEKLWAVWNAKGYCLGELDQLEEAKACYEEALKLEPHDVTVMLNLSEAYLATGELKKGLQIAKKALDESREKEQKLASRYLCICAYLLGGERKKGQEELEDFMSFLKTHKDMRTKIWSFSPLRSTLEKLEKDDKKRIFSLISLLKDKRSQPKIDAPQRK